MSTWFEWITGEFEGVSDSIHSNYYENHPFLSDAPIADSSDANRRIKDPYISDVSMRIYGKETIAAEHRHASAGLVSLSRQVPPRSDNHSSNNKMPNDVLFRQRQPLRLSSNAQHLLNIGCLTDEHTHSFTVVICVNNTPSEAYSVSAVSPMPLPPKTDTDNNSPQIFEPQIALPVPRNQYNDLRKDKRSDELISRAKRLAIALSQCGVPRVVVYNAHS
jgi:hypothetical protein